MEERSKKLKRKRVDRSNNKEAVHTARVNRSNNKEAVYTTISDLPYSILGEIFSRLPLNAILSCSSVSESWRNLFLDPDFANQVPLLKSLPTAKSYILRSNKHAHRIHPRKLCLVNPEEALSCTSSRCDGEGDRNNVTINFKPDFGLPTPGHFEVVNSCNGFLCLCDSQSRYPNYILNPITGEYIKLPLDVPKNKEIGNCSVVSRFGFSPLTKQYKVIRCFSNHSPNKSRIEIHTLGTRTWRRIGDWAPIIFFTNQTHYDVFFKGSLHWTTPDCNFICSFNFGDERIRYITPPSVYRSRYRDNKDNKFNVSLGVIGGCLFVCFMAQNYPYPEIWVMKEYSVNKSWTRLLVITGVHSSFRPLRLLKNGEFLLYNGGDLVSCQRTDLIHRKSSVKFVNCGIKNFQLVTHTPSFTSFKNIKLGQNLKVFRVNMIREREKTHKIGQSEDKLKFNVYGSARGKLGAAGIGGALKDDKDNVLCLFSSPIGIKESNEAELLAIWKALKLFKDSEWNNRVQELVIESGSKVALAWINNAFPPPANLNSVFNEINNFISAIQRVRFVHSFKKTNHFANELAKIGEARAVEFCEWF